MTTAGATPSPAGIRSVEILLTASCNLRCSYCYQNDKKNRRMEWDTVRAGLDLVLRSDPREVGVLFIGGEPLLELPLIRRAVDYVAAERPAGKSVQYAMSTNGLLVDEDAAAFLAEHHFDTQLSFDGVAAAQDERGHGTHAKLDALLDRIRRDHPGFYRERLRTAITLHSKNIHLLADSVDYFLDKRVARIEIGTLMTHDPGWTDGHRDELDRQFARIFDRSLRHYEETGEVPVYVLRRVTEPSRHKPEARSMCNVAKGEGIAVDVDGQVTGCLTFAQSYQELPSAFLQRRLDAMRMGDVRDPAFPRRLALYPEAVHAAEIFDAKHLKRSSYARCGDCRFLGECSVCPTSIGHIPLNDDPHRVPDHACAYNLVALSYRERFPRQPTDAEILAGRATAPRLLRELFALTGG